MAHHKDHFQTVHRESGKLCIKSGMILPVQPKREVLQFGETGQEQLCAFTHPRQGKGPGNPWRSGLTGYFGGIDLRAGVDTTLSQLLLFTFTPCSQSTPSLIPCTPMPSSPASSGWILQHRHHHKSVRSLASTEVAQYQQSGSGSRSVLLSDVTAVKSWWSLKRRSWKCCRGSSRGYKRPTTLPGSCWR